ncbi:MAG: hypothetical protein J0I41_22300 [Filimonas sp.]|nr:hypothetical protein [Filimonas sp.]
MKSQLKILTITCCTILLCSCGSGQLSREQVAETKAAKDTKSCCTGKTPPRFAISGVPGAKKTDSLSNTKSK